MDHFVVVSLQHGVPESFLESLRQAGWRVSLTSDVMQAKQLLQQGDVAGVVLEFDSSKHDPECLKVLRFVHEFCPGTTVFMLNASVVASAGAGLAATVNSVEETRNGVPDPVLNLYKLSPAQKRIASLVAQAYPNREIARRLKIKEQSVRNELSRVFKKMGIWNRVELALLMREGHNVEAATSVNRAPREQRDSEEHPKWSRDMKTPVSVAGFASQQLPPERLLS